MPDGIVTQCAFPSNRIFSMAVFIIKQISTLYMYLLFRVAESPELSQQATDSRYMSYQIQTPQPVNYQTQSSRFCRSVFAHTDSVMLVSGNLVFT